MTDFAEDTAPVQRLLQALTGSPVSASLVRAVFLLSAGIVCGNAVLFSLAAATPLIQADGWYFLDSFLSRYFDGSLTVADLFMKRGGIDHAQPLQKLVLLFHTRYFDMDFRVEGFIGVLFGVLWCWAVVREMRSPYSLSLSRRIASYAGILLVFALGLSLNSTNVFTWPLVTLGYLALLLSTVYFSVAMSSWTRCRPIAILLATAVLGLCVDSQAIVVLIAMTLALAPFRAESRGGAWRQILAAVAGLLLARGVLWWLARQSGLGETVGGERRPLLSVLTEPGALNGLLVPFADSLVHLEHLVRLFPNTYPRMMAICAGIVAVLHVWFWLRVFIAWRNGQYGRTVAMSAFLMLLAYGLTAAIVIGRVPMFDWNYLHQPRYVLTYQVSLVALAMMLQVTIRDVRICSPPRAVEALAIVAVIAALLLCQLRLSREAWTAPHYLTSYWQNAALAMQRLANAPRAAPGQCPDIMVVCEYTPERREQLMGVLTKRKLNLFSPYFQMRNRLYPDLASIPGFAGVEATQDLDRTVRDAERPATLSISHHDSCATGDTALNAVIDVQTNGLASDGAQLWLETIGGSRQLLATIAPHQAALRLNKQLPNRSHLALVRNGSNSLLAKTDLELAKCDAAAP